MVELNFSYVEIELEVSEEIAAGSGDRPQISIRCRYKSSRPR